MSRTIWVDRDTQIFVRQYDVTHIVIAIYRGKQTPIELLYDITKDSKERIAQVFVRFVKRTLGMQHD
jgi:hypothetical protein